MRLATDHVVEKRGKGARAEGPRPPAGPGDLTEEKPAPLPTRKDEPKATPPAGPGKFPEPGEIPPEDERAADAHARRFVGYQDDATGSDAELDERARITPADIERAKQAWRRSASPAFRDLLDGESNAEPKKRG